MKLLQPVLAFLNLVAEAVGATLLELLAWLLELGRGVHGPAVAGRAYYPDVLGAGPWDVPWAYS